MNMQNLVGKRIRLHLPNQTHIGTITKYNPAAIFPLQLQIDPPNPRTKPTQLHIQPQHIIAIETL